MAKNAMDQMLDRFKIKIIKKEADSRTSICGEPFISPSNPDHDGTMIEDRKASYCVIPAAWADYYKELYANSNYVVSVPFIPGVDDKPNIQTAPEATEGTTNGPGRPRKAPQE